MSTNMSQAFKDIAKNPRIYAYFLYNGYRESVYREKVSSNILDTPNIRELVPFACVNDIQNENAGYASNRPRYTESIIQFSAWHKNFAGLDEINDLLAGEMAQMGYVETFSYTTIDPDIELPYLVKRYKFQK